MTISDLVKRGQFVTIVTASDEDSSDAHNLAYSIVGGNEKQAFTIDEYSGNPYFPFPAPCVVNSVTDGFQNYMSRLLTNSKSIF